MNPADDTRATLEALLVTVARDRDRRCQELANEAETRATVLFAEARTRARRTVSEAVASERRRDREAYRLMQARIDTHHRLQTQRIQKQQLERAWQQLQSVLQRRWRQANSRRVWIEAALKRAGLVLQPDHWTIAHPPDWSAEERSRTHDWLRDRTDVSTTFEAEVSISAGLRVRRDQACFDATLDGLLAARHRIEAEMLAELEPEADRGVTP